MSRRSYEAGLTKRKKDLRDKKSSIVGIAKGLNLFDRGNMFLVAT